MTKITVSLFASAFLAVAFSFVGFTGPKSAVAAGDTFVLGRITENPQKHFAAMQDMGSYIVGHLKDLGYTKAEVVVAKSMDEMAQLLRDGKVDALSETPFGATHLVDEVGAEALLREWKKGVSAYRSVFFSAKENGVENLEGLRGKTVVFEDEGSTSGFLMPLAILRMEGLEAVKLNKPTETPPADKVGYFFSNNEMSQLILVARGTAAAGAFSNLDWAEYQEAKKLQGKLKVFHEGDAVMRSVFLVRDGLSDAVKVRIAQTLLNMDSRDAGKRVLKSYNKVKKYDQPTPKEMAESLSYIRSMATLLTDQTAN